MIPLLTYSVGWSLQEGKAAGEDFKSLISTLLKQGTRLDPRNAQDHLDRFTAKAFAERVNRIFLETLNTNNK